MHGTTVCVAVAVAVAMVAMTFFPHLERAVALGEYLRVRMPMEHGRQPNQIASLSEEQVRKELKFIHITKTGGTSIERWANATGLKWGQFHSEYKVRGVLGPVWHIPFPRLRASLRHRYDWFMVVRDPIERMVSEYYCPWGGSKRLENDTEYDFNRFVRRRSRDRRWRPGRGAGHFIPMSKYLDPSSVQHILHFEHLELDLAQLLSSYGINFTGFPHMNEARGRRFNSSHFWPETLRVICRIYAADFENFNYGRDRCPDESGASSYMVSTAPLMAALLKMIFG